jgi:predicted lipoprotein
MKKQIIALALGATVLAGILTGCKKDEDNQPNTDFETMQTQALQDFVNVVGNPLYAQFKTKAATLKDAVHTLATSPTTSSQAAARDAWRAVRVLWEQSEGFLIGPVEDDNYDPYMDTWPTDHNGMQDLLNGSTPLTVQFLEGYDNPEDAAELNLRGFHPLEFLLWGTTGNRDANYTQREKEYMTALADDIYNNVSKLQESWLPSGDDFAKEITDPGMDGSRYSNKKDILKALASVLSDICGEVGESKMLNPFDPQPDSTITESPYSHNSIADFKNNITGAYQVYLCSFDGNQGTSLSNLVAVNNKTLDAEIKQKFQAVLNSFDGITTTFEQAVYSQRSQVQTVLDAIASLKETLDGELVPYFEQYIKD